MPIQFRHVTTLQHHKPRTFILQASKQQKCCQLLSSYPRQKYCRVFFLCALCSLSLQLKLAGSPKLHHNTNAAFCGPSLGPSSPKTCIFLHKQENRYVLHVPFFFFKHIYISFNFLKKPDFWNISFWITPNLTNHRMVWVWRTFNGHLVKPPMIQ